jgi:hypothetical protein
MNISHTIEADGNRGLIPGRLVRVSGEAARVGAPVPCDAPGEPRVELIREGETLRAIDVICTCGQRIRLRCVYAGPA